MKKISYFIGGIIILLTSSCSNKPTLNGEIAGLKEDTLFLNYQMLSSLDSVVLDTVSLIDGKFSLSPHFTEAVLLTIKPQVAILEDGNVNFNQVLTILLEPGKHLKLKGKYSEKMIEYDVEGSEFMENYSKLRSQTLPTAVELNELYIQYDLAESQNEPETTLENIVSLVENKRSFLNTTSLEWIKANTNTDLGAYLLSRQPLDTIGKYYFKMGKDGLNGAFKFVLENRYNRFLSVEKAKENEAKIVVGAEAPNFALYDDKNTLRQLSDYKGKYIVLDFWGSWCIWCIRGLPEMKKYYEKYGDQIEFIGIDCKESEEKWKKAIVEHQIPWVNLYNKDNNMDEDVSITYAVKGFPSKIIIDPNLVIVGIYIGESADFYEKLDDLMKKDAKN